MTFILFLVLSSNSTPSFVNCIASMGPKLLLLYLLAITGLAVVQAGTLTSSWRLIRPVRWFVNSIRRIAPLTLDYRDDPSYVQGGLGTMGQSS